MDLESLLKANVELQKRIATDRVLRHHFSHLWQIAEEPTPAPTPAERPAKSAPTHHKLTLNFPREMCELLAREVERTGKTPDQILEDSFAEYYFRKHGPPPPEPKSP